MSLVVRRGRRRPQVVWSDDHRLRTIGRQLESEAGVDGSIGPVASDVASLRQIIGMLGSEGGRIFLTEGTWIFDGSLSVSTKNLHLYSTSPGRTVFKRAATSTATAHMLSFTGESVIVEGIRFIDSVTSGHAAIELNGQRSIVKNCVFEDVTNGVEVAGANWCAVRDCHFIAVGNYAIEYSGTCEGGVVTGNIIETSGGDIYLGDDVSGTVVTGNALDVGDRKISYFTGQNISTGSALNAIGPTKVEERS